MRTPDMSIDLDSLQQLFLRSSDIQFQPYTFQSHTVYFITCDSMFDAQLLNEVVIPNVRKLYDDNKESISEQVLCSSLYIPKLQIPKTEKELITLVYTGHVLVYFEELQLVVAGNIESKPNRSPEETRLEVPVKGPRDNFIEDISVNIALIRK